MFQCNQGELFMEHFWEKNQFICLKNVEDGSMELLSSFRSATVAKKRLWSSLLSALCTLSTWTAGWDPSKQQLLEPPNLTSHNCWAQTGVISCYLYGARPDNRPEWLVHSVLLTVWLTPSPVSWGMHSQSSLSLKLMGLHQRKSALYNLIKALSKASLASGGNNQLISIAHTDLSVCLFVTSSLFFLCHILVKHLLTKTCCGIYFFSVPFLFFQSCCWL